MSGHEHPGVMLVLLIVCCSKRGRKLLRDKGMTTASIKKWALLLETMLGWQQWLKRDYISREELLLAEPGIRLLMHHYGKIVNRTKGVGMDFIKFHMAICHIVSEIFDNGVPANINTGPVESHHKFNGVAPSETTQHRADDFELQTCYQYLERLCIARAFESLPESKKPNDEVKAPTTGGAEFAIEVTEGPEGELSFAEFRWKSKDNHSRYQARHINWIADNIVANLPYPAIAGFTEQIRETFLFRTHPQFRSIDPWQDWAMIRWDSTLTPTPGQLICFIDLTDGLTDNEAVPYHILTLPTKELV